MRNSDSAGLIVIRAKRIHSRESLIMNLEDLILDTQISELNRLQSGCLKAREAILRIQALSAQLDDQATRVKAEFESTHAAKTQRLIERVESEAQKRREQNANLTASQYQATRAARAEQIKALNTQLKLDIADCQRQLHSKLRELRNTEADAKTLLDAGTTKKYLQTKSATIRRSST
jgi:hypothetical protein